MRYFGSLSIGRTILWCYLIWYLFFASLYFDRNPKLWLTSVGISAIIGVALLLSTWHEQARFWSWTTFRLFLMPFCVSSFSALVKGRDFILVFSPRVWEDACAGVLIAIFCLYVWGARRKQTARLSRDARVAEFEQREGLAPKPDSAPLTVTSPPSPGAPQ